MNKLIRSSVVLGIIGFSASSAFAGNGTGNATADVSAAITVTENTPIAFGSILKDGTGATLVLDTAGSITGAPGGYSLAGSPTAAQFTANGDASSAVSISFSTGDTLVSGANSMALGSFSHNAGGSPVLSGAGAMTFNVGASLTVDTAQASGSYAGTYDVTVNYQ